MARYKGLEGQTLFDVAVLLHKDLVLGIADIVKNNPSINLNSNLTGVNLQYTAGLQRVKPVFVEDEKTKVKTYTTRTAQTVYDLSIQLYGDISKIGNVIKDFPNLNQTIPIGASIDYEEQTDPQALFFTDRNIIVATDLIVEVINYRITEGGHFRITEDGQKRILE